MQFKRDLFLVDLIPVSSTVIPLHELTVTSHGGNNTEGEHPKMLSRQEIKRILKKHMISEEDPHQLITGGFKDTVMSGLKSTLKVFFCSQEESE